MTTPAGGSLSPDRPANSRLRTLTVALVAAAGVVVTLVATHHTTPRLQLCMLNAAANDSTSAQIAVNVRGTDTVFVADSAVLAQLDTLSGFISAAPCEVLVHPDSALSAPASH